MRESLEGLGVLRLHRFLYVGRLALRRRRFAGLGLERRRRRDRQQRRARRQDQQGERSAGRSARGLVDRAGDRAAVWAAANIFSSIHRARSSTSCASRRRAATPITTASLRRRSRRHNGIFWPCPTEDHPARHVCLRNASITRTEKRSFTPIEYNPPNEVPDEEYPLDSHQRARRLSVSFRQSNTTHRLSRPAVPRAVRRDSSRDCDEARRSTTASG